MTTSQVLVAHAVKILVLLTLAGIVARRRWSICWFFTPYLAVILLCNSLVSFWPQHFYQPWFYLFRTALYDALKLAIAIELAYRTFQAFPGTQATARRVLFVLVIASSAPLLAVPWDLSGAALSEWQPRILTMTIWVLVLTVVVIWRYRVPMYAYQKAILLGFVSYLLVFTILLRLLHPYGWDILPLVQWAEPVAFLLLMGWWAWAAWEPVRSRSDHGPTNRNSSGFSSTCGNSPSIPAPFGCAYAERHPYRS
jgi:hypothetical protein